MDMDKALCGNIGSFAERIDIFFFLERIDLSE